MQNMINQNGNDNLVFKICKPLITVSNFDVANILKDFINKTKKQ